MQPSVDRQAIRAVVALNPGGAARNILEIARQHAGVDRAALYALVGDRLELRASQGVDQKDLDHRVPMLWSQSRSGLLRGETAFADGMLAVPIGQPVSGLLYLAAPGLGDLRAIPLRHILVRLYPFFEEAVAAEDEGQLENARRGWLVRTPIEDIEREKLALSLERNEWNVARTSRDLGVSRRTMYKRIRKYRLKRPGGSRPMPQRAVEV